MGKHSRRRAGMCALFAAVLCAAASPLSGEEPKPIAPLPNPTWTPPDPVRPVAPAPTGPWRAPEEEGGPAKTGEPARPRLEAPREEGMPDAKAEAAPPTPRDPPRISALLAEALAKEEAARRQNPPPKAAEIVALYRGVVEAEPNNAEARYRLGLALARAGDPKSAASELERAVVLAPQDPRLLTDFATVATQIGSLEKALDAAVRAIQADPGYARAYNALGNVHLAAGANAKAVDAYSLAVSHAPNNVRYIHNLGRAYLAGANPKMAVEVLTEVLRLDPTCADAYNDRATAYRELKDLDRAMNDLHQAISSRPDFALGHYNLALIYSNEQDPLHAHRFRALEHAQSAVRLTDSKDAQFLMGLAEAYRMNREFEKAVETARQATRLDPRKEYQERLAQLQQLQKQKFTARAP